MILTSLSLSHFRNIPECHLDFSPGVHVFYGDNAQGKTNLLESIYVCATSRSHRAARDRELIDFEEEEAHIKMTAERRDGPLRIDMHLRSGKSKGVAVNGIPIRKVSELFGNINVIFFSPEDLSIIKNSPAERRKFMDMELCQLDSFYTRSLSSYNRALMQRNKLLKECEDNRSLLDTIDVWDEQLTGFGKIIIRERDRFIREIAPVIQEIHTSLTGGREHIDIRYAPNVPEEAFSEELHRKRARDLGARTTLTGPHRDDIECLVDGIDIRKYGSQGQQRTAALSLKLSEIELVKKRLKDAPVLLLDDVFSELDSGRQEHLLTALSGVQTFITCTGLDDFITENIHIDRTFYVEHGSISEKKC